MSVSLKPIRSLSKSKEVFNAVRSAILSGALQPGDALKEAHLARELHVSQVPVREALLQLEHLGLVVRIPDKGTTVTKLSRAEALELLEVRAHLEELAFCLAAKHLTEDAVKELRQCVADIEKEITGNNHYAAAEADLRFHSTVWKIAGNHVLERTLERLCSSVLAFVSLKRHSAKESLRETIGQHSTLLKVLEEGTPNEIVAAVREHINPTRAISPNILE